jgi:hypothetical protein
VDIADDLWNFVAMMRPCAYCEWHEFQSLKTEESDRLIEHKFPVEP